MIRTQPAAQHAASAAEQPATPPESTDQSIDPLAHVVRTAETLAARRDAESAAYEAYVTRHRERLVGLARRLMSKFPDGAEDIVSEVLVAMWRLWPRLYAEHGDDDLYLRNYGRRAVINRVHSHNRKIALTPIRRALSLDWLKSAEGASDGEPGAGLVDILLVDDGADTTEAAALRHEEQTTAMALLMSATYQPRQRFLLILRLQGYSINDAAAVLERLGYSASPDVLKDDLHRISVRLRRDHHPDYETPSLWSA